MTYARARLLLGMFGVGSIAVLSTLLLLSRYLAQVLPESEVWSINDFTALLSLFGCLAAVLLPLDLLGGFLLPNRWRPHTISFGAFFVAWLRGVIAQGALFLAASLLILFMGRWLAVPGAALAVAGVAVFLVRFQLHIAKFVGALEARPDHSRVASAMHDRDLDAADGQAFAIDKALEIVRRWGWKPMQVTVLRHHDPGFTGGIVGLPGNEIVVLPATAVDRLSSKQLAVMIARRLEAVQSGSRTRGLILALAWVLTGFTLSAYLPGAGVASVGELATTCLGFTLWTFLGLLTLPTLSRQATHAIDGKLLRSDAPRSTFDQTVRMLDKLQDDEPRRSEWIETIFHPVPSVENRGGVSVDVAPIAWHAARITLFVSWACMGTLVRAVHCNVGRPELWVMLPTD